MISDNLDNMSNSPLVDKIDAATGKDDIPKPKPKKITKRDNLLKIIRDYNKNNPDDKQRKYSHLKVKELELLTDRLNAKSK
jgi:hypothetical protein